MSKMVIGITGPTGSGKSTALAVLQKQGFTVVDCDKVYHKLLQTDTDLRQQLTDTFGDIFLSNGQLDRKKLAERVFGDERELERLNAIVYPKMSAHIRQKLLNCSQKGLAIDAVNLLQSGLGKLCHVTVGITAPEANRLRRIMERDGLDEIHARARIAAQKPDSYYRRHCTFLLENRAESPQAFTKLVESFFEDIFLVMEE